MGTVSAILFCLGLIVFSSVGNPEDSIAQDPSGVQSRLEGWSGPIGSTSLPDMTEQRLRLLYSSSTEAAERAREWKS